MNLLRDKISRLLKIKFVADTIVLQLGQIWASLLGFVIALLLGPFSLGLLALARVKYTLIQNLIILRFDVPVGVKLSEYRHLRDRQAIVGLLSFYFYADGILSLLCLGIGWVMASLPTFQMMGGSPEERASLTWCLRILLLQVLFFPLKDLLSIIPLGFRAMKYYSWGMNLEMLISALALTGVVLYAPKVEALCWGITVSQGLAIIPYQVIFRRMRRQEALLPGVAEILRGFRWHNARAYCYYFFLLGLDKNVGNVLTALPFQLAGNLIPVSVIGCFELARKIYLLPLRVLGTIVANLGAKMPELKDPRHWKLAKAQMFKVTLVSVLITTGLMLALYLATPLISRCFPQYQGIADFFPPLAALAIGIALTTTFSPFFRTFEKVLVPLLNTVVKIIILWRWGPALIGHWGGHGLALSYMMCFLLDLPLLGGYFLWLVFRRPAPLAPPRKP